MAGGDGRFVWYELVTSDVDAAQAFYGKVIGWTVEDAGGPGMRYLIGKVGDRRVAGMMNFVPGCPEAPVGWTGYIGVDDVDATAERVREAGGSIHREPGDIPGVGRFAVVADPRGAVFDLFHGDGDAASVLPAGATGGVGWHELRTDDWEAAFAFYQRLFGWVKAYGHDMGPMGIYQTFDVDGVWTGGMMNFPEAPPHWAYYFKVDDIDAAVGRIAEAGGKVLDGPHEVPGGSFVAMATDPQGGHFALTGTRKG